MNDDDTDDDELSDWEKLQILAISDIVRTGKTVATLGGYEIVIDYTDR